MLKILRKKGVAKKLLWVIAVVIILSFGVFGTANYVQKQEGPTTAGKIFGKTVSFDEFQKSVLYTRSQAIIRYGDNFDKIQKFLDLDSEAWDRLILLHEAKKRRIKIIDQEVVDAIGDFAFFKNNEKFDPVLYKKIVRYVFRCEPRDFEEGVRESLIFAKLLDDETASMSVSDDEVYQAYQSRGEQAQASYILFTSDELKKDMAVDAAEAQSYFEGHKEDFKLPAAINAQYVLAEFSPDADAAKKADAEAAIRNVSDELQKEPDLEMAAKKFGLEASESGFFNIEQPDLKLGWPYELLQRAFTLEQGEISEPVETSKGYYIIKIKEKKDSHLPDFYEVSDKVSEVLLNKKAQELTKQKAEKTLSDIKKVFAENPNAKFSEVAANLGFQATQTPLFKRGAYLPNLGVSQDFQEKAFALSNSKESGDIVETTKGYCVIHLDQLVPADQEKYENEKEELRKNLLTARKTEAFSSFLGRLRANAKLVDNIARLKAQAGAR